MRYENSMRKVADDILREEKEKQRFLENTPKFYDEFATMNFFRYVCFRFGNLKSGEIDKLVLRLKCEDVKAVERHEHSRVWNFDYNIMYRVLMENERCRLVCKKNKYSDWMRIIYRCCMDD